MTLKSPLTLNMRIVSYRSPSPKRTHKLMFSELLARSCYSFLEGASHPHELVSQAHKLRLHSIALCDRDGLYGSAKMLIAHNELKAAGHEQKIIAGAELSLERGQRTDNKQARPTPYVLRQFPSVALLCMNQQGYTHLCQLLTSAHALHPKGVAGSIADDIAERSQGLFAVLPLNPKQPYREDEVLALRDAFGDRIAIAVWRHLEPEDNARAHAALELSKRLGLPIVASARPIYHAQQRKDLADVLRCIRTGTTLDQAGSQLTPNAAASLKSEAHMRRLFPQRPQWLKKTLAIAEQCEFSLSDISYNFPSNHGNPSRCPNQNLRIAVEQGCRDRYGSHTPLKVKKQLEKELQLIAELDVAPYFLSVQHIVNIARARSILCQGRGSAANSAVCFVLGITAVDPARSSLLFERFMSTARREPPDIDVDFEHERREEVIQEVYRRYGRERAAMVSEIICYRGKSSLREVGKIFALSNEQLNRLSQVAHVHASDARGDRLQSSVPETTREALGKRGLDPEDSRLQKVLQIAHELSGFPRHLSIHVGGFVLSSDPLFHVAPIEPASMPNRTVIPWDKDDIDALGFFKVDVLGLGMLTAVRKALRFIVDRNAHTAFANKCSKIDENGEKVFDPIRALAAIPPEDPSVYDACCRADTVGVFQIESRAQMAMLPILRPRSFYDLVIEVGIVRPGPIQGKMVHPYLRRRTGEESVRYPHPCLENILKRTLGVPLFQEQVMQIAIDGAGYAPCEADRLRRDMAAWKKDGRLLSHREKLLSGFKEKGLDKEFSESLFQQILGFGEYGFPECVVAETLIIDADNGQRVPIEDIVSGAYSMRHTLACDAHFRIQKRALHSAVYSGIKTVYNIKTALGHQLQATAEHPLLTLNGYQAVACLAPGDRIAAICKAPTEHQVATGWKRQHTLVLAHMLTSATPWKSGRLVFQTQIASHHREQMKMLQRFRHVRIAASRNSDEFTLVAYENGRTSQLFQWINDCDLGEKSSDSRLLPNAVFRLNNDEQCLFLARVWERLLCASNRQPGRQQANELRSCAMPAARAEQLQHLLLRQGVVAQRQKHSGHARGDGTDIGPKETDCLVVAGKSNLLRFNERMGERMLDLPTKNSLKKLAAAAAPSENTEWGGIPCQVAHTIERQRQKNQLSWTQLQADLNLEPALTQLHNDSCNRTVKGEETTGGNYPRWLVEALGWRLDSRRLVDLGSSDIVWDKIVSIKEVGEQKTYDLCMTGDHNFVANNLVVHNSHAASFAIIVYASAWLKVHHPAAFAAALINSQPMGFYAPRSIVSDAQRHGVEVRPVCVQQSQWDCTLEEKSAPGDASSKKKPSIRLGLRLVQGLGHDAAEQLLQARQAEPFRSVEDVINRSGLRLADLERLAESGALQGMCPSRREALWQLRAPRNRELYRGLPIEAKGVAGLKPLSKREQLALDFGTTGISLDDHPIRHVRSALTKHHLKKAEEQIHWRQGQRVTVAGMVLSRQRPQTAKGIVFMTLEDETGTLNLVIYAHVFERYELVAKHARLLLAKGQVDRRKTVVHVRVQHLERLDRNHGTRAMTAPTRDFR